MVKTLGEKNKLSSIVNSGGNKMLSDGVYAKLSKDIFKVFKQIKTAQGDSGEIPPLT
jgi:ABC-type amino acid transport substrate-binding protein